MLISSQQRRKRTEPLRWPHVPHAHSFQDVWGLCSCGSLLSPPWLGGGYFRAKTTKIWGRSMQNDTNKPGS